MKQYKAVNVEMHETELDNFPVLRVIKPLENPVADTDTYARLVDRDFHNGTICCRMYSDLQKGAPDYSRGFIGIVFRVNETDSEFESFYVRPTNGRHPDPIRRSHGSQYFSYPGYTFDYFRKHGITSYEAPIDAGLKEWIDLKAIIHDDHGEFYVNDMDKPVLVVDGFKHGPDAKGAVGLYVDIGTEGFFQDLQITYED